MWIDDQLVLSRIHRDDTVLDVGGWACPFNRANFVLDSMPYESRGFYGTIGLPASQGGTAEHFTSESWYVRDICEKTPWPFPEKFFDFSICAHVLEDVRDPLFVCTELMRVSKAGYIEVPSRLFESCRGCEAPKIAGLSHHRWLITAHGMRLDFLMKFHAIHARYDLALPASFAKQLSMDQRTLSFFWENKFEIREIEIHGAENIQQELRSFVSQYYRYSFWRRNLYALTRWRTRTLRSVCGHLMGRLRMSA